MRVRINGCIRRKKSSLVCERLPVQTPAAPPKVTPLCAAAVRSLVIYSSFGGKMLGGVGLDASGLEALPG